MNYRLVVPFVVHTSLSSPPNDSSLQTKSSWSSFLSLCDSFLNVFWTLGSCLCFLDEEYCNTINHAWLRLFSLQNTQRQTHTHSTAFSTSTIHYKLYNYTLFSIRLIFLLQRKLLSDSSKLLWACLISDYYVRLWGSPRDNSTDCLGQSGWRWSRLYPKNHLVSNENTSMSQYAGSNQRAHKLI